MNLWQTFFPGIIPGIVFILIQFYYPFFAGNPTFFLPPTGPATGGSLQMFWQQKKLGMCFSHIPNLIFIKHSLLDIV